MRHEPALNERVPAVDTPENAAGLESLLARSDGALCARRTPSVALERADAALYRAGGKGRNRAPFTRVPSQHCI
jgi:hypothetical protein